MRKGKLPTFKKLMKQGSYGELESSIPPRTCPAWPVFYTGKNPGKLGVTEFTYVDPKLGKTSVVNSLSIKEPRVWEMVKGKAYVINVPMTYPPTSINGAMITGMTTPSAEKHFTYPEKFKEKILNICGDCQIEPHIIQKIGKKKYLEEIYHITDNQTKLLRYFMKEEWDLLVIVFRLTDVVQHFFWEDMLKKTKYKDIIDQAYMEMDTIVSEVLNELGKDTTLILMSDHGAEFWDTKKKVQTFHITEWLRQNDYLKLKQRKTGGKAVRIYNWFLKRGINLHKFTSLKMRMKIRDPTENFDWENTIAFPQQCSFRYGGIRINLRNREPNGTVMKKDFEKIRNEIMKRLKNIKDLKTGKKFIEKVWKDKELYHGKNLDKTPDIMFKTKMNYTPRVIVYDRILSEKIEIGGIHNEKGIFFAYGPKIKKRKVKANILDITPTILHILKVPLSKDFDGKVLKKIFKSGSDFYKRKIKYMPKKEEKMIEEKRKIKEKLKGLRV